MFDGKDVFIIAEAGVNHNGNLGLAKELIDAAKYAGADAVKFQTWMTGEITGKFCGHVPYSARGTKHGLSRYELSEKVRLSYEQFADLKAYADSINIQFLSTPDGFKSLQFLVDELMLRTIKIGSAELNNLEFIEACSEAAEYVILSTGLGTFSEVATAVEVLRRATASSNFCVLQCVSSYPAAPHSMNLAVMQTFADAFGCNIGLSDHSVGPNAMIAATALGAKVVEKHLTLDKSMEGPDHSASATPDEMKYAITGCREVSAMIGNGIKAPVPEEIENFVGIRRSVVASRNLIKGHRVSRQDLECKRPGSGIEPRNIDAIVGLRLNRDVEEDQPLVWSYFS